MKRALIILLFVAFCSTVVALAQGQTPAPAPSDLEPAVDTSAEQDETRTQTPGSEPSDTRDARTGAGAGRTRTPPARAMDRIELDATEITGNRELPKVLYIVPWKRSDLGDLVGKPVGSLLDEVLAPVDRDVFKRENRYYRALRPGEPVQPATSAPPADAAARDES